MSHFNAIMMCAIFIVEENTRTTYILALFNLCFSSKVVCAEPIKTLVEAVSKCKIYFTLYRINIMSFT